MKDFTTKLVNWYRVNRRDFPWRRTQDPYRIWVSEIILQQTRIEQGLGYYERFTERFPDIRSLSIARPDEVMRCWQGLGYYSRARNMMEAAGQIMEQHGGIFPSTFAEIRTLKGIGPYTAAAIASISFGEPVPVVDGNVIRFLSRLFGIEEPADSAAGKKTIHSLAARLLDPQHPGDFNQGLMEFGQQCCKPANPLCLQCIFSRDCRALQTGKTDQLPVKGKPVKVTDRYFHYLVVTYTADMDTFFYIHRREGKDIWNGLYEFPLIETTGAVTPAQLVKSGEWKELTRGCGARVIRSGPEVKHQLSHRLIHAVFFEVKVNRPLSCNFLQINEKDINKYPMAKLTEKYLNGRNK